MGFALAAAVVLREQVRRGLGGEMTNDLAALIFRAEGAVGALSRDDMKLYSAWAYATLTPDERADLVRSFDSTGDA